VIIYRINFTSVIKAYIYVKYKHELYVYLILYMQANLAINKTYF